MTPEQRSMRSRVAAYAALARNDPRELTAEARRVYRDGFREGHACALCPRFVMPAGLSEEEIDRRASALRKGHYGRLALKSSLTRSRGAKKGPPAIVAPGGPRTGGASSNGRTPTI